MEKFLPNERLRLYGDVAELNQELASRNPALFSEHVCADSTKTSAESASKAGIAVSLIDGMIATSRILWMMDLHPTEIQEALRDLKQTYELEMLMTLETESPQGRMHDEEWRKRD